MIVERARPRPGAGAGPETRAVVAGTRVRAASVERTDLDVASEALLCYEAAEARAVAAEARVALTEARARAVEARAVTALTRARAAEVARVRAYATASVLRVENTGLLAKLDASEAAAAAAAARAAETENQLKALQGTILDPTHIPPSPPFYVPTVPVHPPPMVLGPIAPGSIPWSYYAPPPPPDTIYQGTFIDLGYKSDTLKYGHFKVENTQNIVFVSPEDVPDGYLSEGDRCEFRIVEYRNQRNRRNGTFQRKAVDVVCIKRAVPVPPQPSC